jgi:hypothetical protein
MAPTQYGLSAPEQGAKRSVLDHGNDQTMRWLMMTDEFIRQA